MRKLVSGIAIALCLVAFSAPLRAADPAAQPVLDLQKLSSPETPLTPEEPSAPDKDVTKPVFLWEDSGICCTSSTQCPNVSGYAKKCDIASCGRSCLYRRL